MLNIVNRTKRPVGRPDTEMDAKVRAMLERGCRPKEIAFELGVSRQAVSQRMKRAGLVARRVPRKRQVGFSQKYGMPMAQVVQLRAIGATAAFTRQRENARKRGIEWSLTFSEWWGIWDASGKWEQRGRTKEGYVMGRRGDVGPYAVGNVEICTHRENVLVREAHSPSFQALRNVHESPSQM